jgi:hypothetical protein
MYRGSVTLSPRRGESAVFGSGDVKFEVERRVGSIEVARVVDTGDWDGLRLEAGRG